MSTGFIVCLYWNSCLNIANYLVLNIKEGIFTHYSFAVSLGSLLALIVGPKLFKKLSTKKAIMFSFLMSGSLFYITLYLVQKNINIDLKSLTTTITIFFCGFFVAIISGKGAGISARMGPSEMRLYNFGGGFNGALISLINVLLNIFNPIDPESPVD